MKIAVDARPLRILRSFGNYANQLLPLLIKSNPEIEWYLLGETGDEGLYQKKLAGLSYHFVNLDDNWFSQNLRSFSNKIPQILKDQLFYASYINIFKFDILWHPDNKAFWLYFGKQIATVHDLMPLIFPQYFHTKFQYRFSYWLNTWALKFKTSKIIAISQLTKDDLLKYLKIPDDRITTIYQSGNIKYQVINDADRLDAVRSRLALPKNFALYLGGLNPQKNVEVILDAWSQICRDSTISPFKLVIVGGGKDNVGINLLGKLQKKAQELGIGGRVTFIDYDLVADSQVELYNLAAVFIFPSLYEGFGMPPLEAMACGCPVICSNAASLPEVVDDAGLLFNPTDIIELSEKIRQILENESLRNELKQKGLAQAQKFSWDKCAKETIGVLEKG